MFISRIVHCTIDIRQKLFKRNIPRSQDWSWRIVVMGNQLDLLPLGFKLLKFLLSLWCTLEEQLAMLLNKKKYERCTSKDDITDAGKSVVVQDPIGLIFAKISMNSALKYRQFHKYIDVLFSKLNPVFKEIANNF